MEMKKINITCLVAGLIVGMLGIAQAQCDSQDFFTEGPSYKYSTRKINIVDMTDKCNDSQSFFVEGIRISPCVEGCKTKTIKAISAADFYSEGFSYKELEYMRHLEKVENILPAAGK